MTQPPAPDWSARLALSVAREVRRHRQAQGLSAQQLAARCEAIGMPIQRSVLANLESGRRTTVNLAEVFVLAYALQVPPGVLMFPVGYEREVEILPGASTEPQSAIGWISGETFYTEEASEAYEDSSLRLIRKHQTSVRKLQRSTQAQRYAMRSLARATTEHGDAAKKYERIMQEAMEQRIRLNELATNAKEGQPFSTEAMNEAESLSARHNELLDQAHAYQQEVGTLRNAQNAASAAQARVQDQQAELLELREEIKERGLVPPLLPRILTYIDPDSAPLEDFVDREWRPHAAKWNKIADADRASSIDEGAEEPVPPYVAAPKPDMWAIRDLLEELKPRLSEIIDSAVEDAFRRREREEK